jgi:PAS domain S-box-containing protein
MSIQSVRLQTAYRHLLASTATNAINIERVNGLIYAIVMESRGIYMSTDRPKVKQFGDELLKRNRELADVVAGWEQTVGADDAALNNMPQGVVLLDSKAKVLLANQHFKTMYALPPELFASDCTLEDILTHRTKIGSISGNIAARLAAILARIAKREPSVHEVESDDGRVFRISEQPIAGGGWIATHEDFTEARRAARILERTEQFLATIIENIPEGIVAKDVRNLRYVFINRAAEKMIGRSRAELMGKTARELFPAAAADLIEQRDRQLLTQDQQLEPIVDTIDNPTRGRRTIAVRRLQIDGPDRESRLLVSMIEDRTEQTNVAVVAA